MRNFTCRCNRRDERLDATTWSSAQSSKRNAHVMLPRDKSAAIIELRLSKSLEIFETCDEPDIRMFFGRCDTRTLRAFACDSIRTWSSSVQCVSRKRQMLRYRDKRRSSQTVQKTSIRLRDSRFGKMSTIPTTSRAFYFIEYACNVHLSTAEERSFPVVSTLSVLVK